MSAGHIRRRGAHSWELKYDCGIDPMTGKRITRYASVKGTRRDAQEALTKLLHARDTGAAVDPTKETVSQFIDRWNDSVETKVSPKTRERYAELLRLHVVPHVGTRPIQKLTAADLDRLYSKLLRDSGLAPRTVGHVHRLLHKVLSVALKWGVLTRNIADAAEPPLVPHSEQVILSEDHTRQLLDGLRGDFLYLPVLMLLTTGLRRGELLALRWCDLDLDAGTLRIEQSLEQIKTGMRFKSPKTKHGRRSITLPSIAVAELRQHRKTQQEMRLQLGIGRLPEDVPVISTYDGKPYSPDALTLRWRRALMRLKLPRVTLHSLRHTHASALIASGMDVLTVSRRLGHSSPSITLSVYAHKFANRDAEAARLMDAAFGTITERR
jgi:integrase